MIVVTICSDVMIMAIARHSSLLLFILQITVVIIPVFLYDRISRFW